MRKHLDYLLLGSIISLIIIGVVILASVSAPFSLQKFGTPYYFLKHQMIYGLIPGLILAFLAFKINLTTIKKWSPVLLLINLGFLIMVFLPVIGIETKGASRWLNFGFISFQPSEFLKLTFILYLASFLTKKNNKFSQTFVAFLTVVALIAILLILQPDISTLGIIVLVGLLMYFLAQTPIWHTILVILLGSGGLLLLVKLAAYRIARLTAFLNPEFDPMGRGYQLKQALIAIGSGGIMGQGLGMSQQKFGALPESMSDSIFAVWAEESGFIGGAILIFLFLLFLWASLKIIRKTQDKFSQLAALGITCWICLQTFINIGGLSGILPLTGIPLPFVSYGGSALISELIGMGILLNISKGEQAKR